MNDQPAPSPSSICGGAEHTQWPLLLRWRTFQGIKSSNKFLGLLYEKPHHPFTEFIGEWCRRWAESFTVEEIHRVMALSPDQRLPLFYRNFAIPFFRPKFTAFLEKEIGTAEIGEAVLELFWRQFLNLSLEILVEAFNWFEEMGYRICAGGSVTWHSYQVCLALTGKQIEHDEQEKEARKQAVSEDYYFQRNHTSPQRRSDWDTNNLAPADKVRVFNHAVNWLNEIGYLTRDREVEYGFIEWDKRSEYLEKQFFVLNRECSVSDLMKVIEQCATVRYDEYSPAEGEYDVKWHVRKGCELNFLFYHIDKINDQLGLPFDRDYFRPIRQQKIM